MFGGQRVRPGRLDDGDGAEEVVERGADDRQPLLGQPVAGIGRVGLADGAQHVLAQRRGIADAGQPGTGIGGQRGGQPRQPAQFAGDLGDDGVIEPATFAGVDVGLRRSVDRRNGGSVGDQRGQRPWHRQAGSDRCRQRGQDGACVVGTQLPTGRGQQNLGPRGDPGLQGAPQHRAQRVLPSSGFRVVLNPNCQSGVQVGGRDRIRAARRERGADGGVERRHHHPR